MKIKTTLRKHFTPLRMANINKSTNKCWKGWGKKGTPVYCWWECRLVQPLWKTVWNFLKNLRLELPFDPAIWLLGIYPKSPETQFEKNSCTPMFTAVKFTIAKYWKQPSEVPIDPKTMVHLHNAILCSREKEGAYTLCNSMDGTGEHYFKWNKTPHIYTCNIYTHILFFF